MSQASSIEKQSRPPKMGGRRGIVMGEKAKDTKGTLKAFISFLKPFRVKLIFVIIFVVAATILSVINPKVLAMATDTLADGVRLMTAGTGSIDFVQIGKILIICLCLYAGSALFQYLQGYIIAGVCADISYDLRTRIMKKINNLPVAYYNKVSYGDVLSRITNDVDTINQNLNGTLSRAISSAITLIGVFAMMLTISWKLTLIILITLPLSGGVMALVMKISQKHFKAQQNLLGSVNGKVEENFGGHLVVKAFGGEDEAIEDFNKENVALYNAGWKANFISGLIHPFMGFIGNLGYVAVCIVGAIMTTRGTMTIGGIQAFIVYSKNFTQPISEVAQISNQFQMLIAAFERVNEFITEQEIDDGEIKLKIADLDVRGDIVFDHVKFKYEDTDRIIINDFSATVKAGQKVAIVGPTGAGKTTLVKLLMRFHDITEGAIYLDGHNINEFDRSDLRTEFGMVLQDTWLYQASVKENIRYGRLNATDEEVYAAAKAAQVDHFIRTLPGGYDMEINEEASNISAGQKQLLTIARAIIADSKVMILDEATSSVDTRTETMIQDAMDNLMKGRTSFIIAHRLSTIRNADLILCLDHGDIVEQGTHADLLAAGGFYAKLYNSQFEE